jgi:heme-degrading monooxygenase HmoA
MFVHLAIHYPRPGHVDDVLASMHRVDKAVEGTPGLIQMGAWRDGNSNRVVGLARWESQEAFQASAQRISR